MDVTLVLTHRCNLACGYCYAGEHVRKDMDEVTLSRAVDLLFSDQPDTAQLSFFGGEPFLAFDAMRRAVELTEARAAQTGTRLVLQCTTNGSVLDDEHVAFAREHGLRVTVSIDGVREAHDLNRPSAGGKSSFDQVQRGLRKLVDAGCKPDAMMVISPETTPYVYRSVGFLWEQGIETVRANMVLDAPWTNPDRADLREQLLSVSWELVARRRYGERVAFEPFARGMRGVADGGSARRCPARGGQRDKLVVGTTGFLYPCAPMVGEDRDDGPEAALRLGHLGNNAAAIKASVEAKGTRCGRGGACDCAAYLETGDRTKAGPNGIWYAEVCKEMGRAAAVALAGTKTQASPGTGRRPFLLGMAAAVSGLAVGLPALLSTALTRPAGEMLPPPCDLPIPDAPPPGQMALPPEPPAVEPPPEDILIDGEMEFVEPEIQGRLAPPEPEPEAVAPEDIDILGDIAEPMPPADLDDKAHTAGGYDPDVKVRGELLSE